MSRWGERLACRRFANLVQRWRSIALFTAAGLSFAFEMRNYDVMAVEYPLYEMVTPELMRGLKMLKSPADLR